MSAKVQVIVYSTYGHVYRLAEAVAEGARAVAGSDVQVLQVETLPADVLEKMGATEARKAFAQVPVADPPAARGGRWNHPGDSRSLRGDPAHGPGGGSLPYDGRAGRSRHYSGREACFALRR